jgi:ribosomal protein S18 acetylase RimI-like enzyme
VNSKYSVTTYRVGNNQEASATEWHRASSSPSFLRLLLGQAYQRRRVMVHGVNWERVLFIAVDGEVAGYLQFYLDGNGPHRVSFSDIRLAFGRWSAAWRYPLYWLVQKRYRRYQAYLYRIIIHEDFRGQGLGEQLLQDWLKLVKDQGINQAELEVWGNNTQAIRFYESLGFQVNRTRYFPVRFNSLRDTQLLRMVYKFN